MKKIIILAAVFLLTNALNAQDDYKTAMLNNIKMLDTAVTTASLSQIAATFSAIYEVKKDWHPLYYECYSYVKLSEAFASADQKKTAIDKAAALLDSLPKNNDEVLVLRALYAMDYLAIDRSAWQTYLPIINNSLAGAQAINANNPRSYYLQGILKYNMPASMGGGHEAGIALFKTALQKFDTLAETDELAPTWGRKELGKYLGQ
ncbi:MAG TPA: hypothetical protein VG738_08565 [Chitinophagaceae bacterium]|nr:hypothetical protein [Chitinophagaceae bacterium]